MLTNNDVIYANGSYRVKGYVRDQSYDNSLARDLANNITPEAERSNVVTHLWASNIAIAYNQYRSASYCFTIEEVTTMLYIFINDYIKSYDAERYDFYIWCTNNFRGYVKNQYNYRVDLVHVPLAKRDVHAADYISLDAPVSDDSDMTIGELIDGGDSADTEYRQKKIDEIRAYMYSKYDPLVVDSVFDGTAVPDRNYYANKLVRDEVKKLLKKD